MQRESKMRRNEQRVKGDEGMEQINNRFIFSGMHPLLRLNPHTPSAWRYLIEFYRLRKVELVSSSLNLSFMVLRTEPVEESDTVSQILFNLFSNTSV